MNEIIFHSPTYFPSKDILTGLDGKNECLEKCCRQVLDVIGYTTHTAYNCVRSTLAAQDDASLAVQAEPNLMNLAAVEKQSGLHVRSAEHC